MVIPISFQFKGKQYNGELRNVSGGGNHCYHLMIDNFFLGRLRYVDSSKSWVFDTNKGSEGWDELADYFGFCVTNHLTT